MDSILPVDIFQLVIDDLVRSSYEGDSASYQALLNCMLVCAQFYTDVRPFLCWRLIVQLQDLDVHQTSLLSRFAEHLSADPVIKNLPPLLSVARRIEIAFQLDLTKLPTRPIRGAILANVGKFLNDRTMTSLLEAFSLQRSLLDSFSLICRDHVEKISWTKHIVVEGGRFPQLFETLCQTKVTHLRLCGMEDLPSDLIDQATSVKHLILQHIQLSHTTVARGEEHITHNMHSAASKLSPVLLDVEGVSGDLQIFLDPFSSSNIPYKSILRRTALNFGLSPRFPLLLECRIHWSVMTSLEFLGCIYETAPNLQVILLDGPYFYPQYRPTDGIHPPWCRKPPDSLRRFQLNGVLRIEPLPLGVEFLRYLNFEAVLGSTSQLPRLSQIDVHLRFKFKRFSEDQYWVFTSSAAKGMWEGIVRALQHCVGINLIFELFIGKEFDKETEEGESPRTSEEILGRQRAARDCLEDAFRPLVLINPKAKLIVRFLE